MNNCHGYLLFIVSLLLFSYSLSAHSLQPVATLETVNSQTFDRWMLELSSWGRWGENDELGTINLITPEKRVRAAALVKKGIVVSLSHAVDKSVPVAQWGFTHKMEDTGLDEANDYSVDRWEMIFHGARFTHLDSLCHIFHKGKMYNGFPQSQVTDNGCGKNAVDNFADGIFTRGVLVDFTFVKGVQSLEPGTAITASDLEAWAKKTGTKIESGDAVFIRTGRWKRFNRKHGAWAGLHASAVKWLKDKDVSAVGSDANAEAYSPSSMAKEGETWRTPNTGVENEWFPVHKLLLVAMGTQLFDNLDLDSLRMEAERQGRWDFLFTVAC